MQYPPHSRIPTATHMLNANESHSPFAACCPGIRGWSCARLGPPDEHMRRATQGSADTNSKMLSALWLFIKTLVPDILRNGRMLTIRHCSDPQKSDEEGDGTYLSGPCCWKMLSYSSSSRAPPSPSRNP